MESRREGKRERGRKGGEKGVGRVEEYETVVCSAGVFGRFSQSLSRSDSRSLRQSVAQSSSTSVSQLANYSSYQCISNSKQSRAEQSIYCRSQN